MPPSIRTFCPFPPHHFPPYRLRTPGIQPVFFPMNPASELIDTSLWNIGYMKKSRKLVIQDVCKWTEKIVFWVSSIVKGGVNQNMPCLSVHGKDLGVVGRAHTVGICVECSCWWGRVRHQFSVLRMIILLYGLLKYKVCIWEGNAYSSQLRREFLGVRTQFQEFNKWVSVWFGLLEFTEFAFCRKPTLWVFFFQIVGQLPWSFERFWAKAACWFQAGEAHHYGRLCFLVCFAIVGYLVSYATSQQTSH